LEQIFAMPAVIACVSVIGLVTALLADGLWDAIGWFGLGVPIAVAGWCVLRQSTPR
jgi:hypothetical protein